MIIDNKGKLFGKISIIDIFIVLIVLGALAGVGYKYTKAKVANPITGAKDIIQIQFYSAEALEYAAKSVKVGDPVTDGTQQVSFGKVKEVKIDKAQSYAANSQGQYVPTSRPGCLSVLITVDAPGKVNDQGVTIGTSEYYVGQRIDRLRIGNATIEYSAYVYDIKKTR